MYFLRANGRSDSRIREGLRAISRAVHTRFFTRKLPRRVAICLHELPESRYPAFRTLVSFFREVGYRFVDPFELLNTREERVIMVSFDDNYRSWHRALPLLEQLELRATFYVETGPLTASLGDRSLDGLHRTNGTRPQHRYLRPGEVLDLRRAGHRVGAHAHTHRSLTDLPERVARWEITRSKRILEEVLQEPVLHFSYPYGTPRHFDDRLRSYCREVGFATVANATAGLQHTRWRPYDLDRTVWYLNRSLHHNLTNLAIDGRHFVRLTGRSPVW